MGWTTSRSGSLLKPKDDRISASRDFCVMLSSDLPVSRYFRVRSGTRDEAEGGRRCSVMGREVEA